MIYNTNYTCGYGVIVSEFSKVSFEGIEKLIHLAPVYEQRLRDLILRKWLKEHKIKILKDDDDEFDAHAFDYGLANILCNVIKEAENIELTAYLDIENTEYLLYEPNYPWRTGDKAVVLTEEKLRSVMEKYISILTKEKIKFDYYDPYAHPDAGV